MARRLSELYAARDLANAQLAREGARGARDAQSMGQWTSLLGTGINAASKGIGAVQGYRDTATARDIESALARNASEVGELAPDVVEEIPAAPVVLPPMRPRGAPGISADIAGLPQADTTGDFVPPMPKPTTRTVPGQSSDPYAAARYAETPQQAAARRITSDPALADRTGLDALFGGDRAEARRRAEAQLAQDITGRRGQLDAMKRTAGKDAFERSTKLEELQLKKTGAQDEWKRFLLTADAKQRDGETDRAFQERLLGNKQTFERGENVLDRTSREKNAQVAADAARAVRMEPKPVADAVSNVFADSNTMTGLVKNQLGRLDDMKSRDVSAGSTASLRNDFAVGLAKLTDGMVDWSDPTYNKFKNDNKELYNVVKNIVTGTNAGEKETADLMALVPNNDDPPAIYRQKTEALEGRVHNLQEQLIKTQRATGRDVSGLEALSKPDVSGLEAPSKPDVSGLEAPSKPDASTRAQQLIREGVPPAEVKARLIKEGFSDE